MLQTYIASAPNALQITKHLSLCITLSCMGNTKTEKVLTFLLEITMHNIFKQLIILRYLLKYSVCICKKNVAYKHLQLVYTQNLHFR